MDQYEKAIREKIFKANILTPGEWVYLIGTFQFADEHAECDGPHEISRLRQIISKKRTVPDVMEERAQAVTVERERCARVLEQHMPSDLFVVTLRNAAAIVRDSGTKIQKGPGNLPGPSLESQVG